MYMCMQPHTTKMAVAEALGLTSKMPQDYGYNDIEGGNLMGSLLGSLQERELQLRSEGFFVG